MGDDKFKLAAPSPARLNPLRSPYRHGKTTIGVMAPCYGASHVIYGLNTPSYRHEKVAAVTLSKLDRNGTFFAFTPLVLDFTVPLIHSWNSIPVNKNFIVSFELEIPRYLGSHTNREIEFALDMLRSRRCKAILPLSDFAARWAKMRFEEFGYDDLNRKMRVFRGAVDDPLSSLSPPRLFLDPTAGPLRAILVGTQLFHKGITFAIKAFEQLRAAGRDVELTIIGAFEPWSHAYRDLIPDAGEWLKRIEQAEWISLRPPASRVEVLTALRDHHLCLSPSLDESLGWLTIEAQLTETPVIANRVCAHPELVQHAESGWLIDLPLTSDGRWVGMSATGNEHRKAHAHADKLITQGIIDAVEAVLATPSLLEQWGQAGRANMLRLYGIEQASIELESIYAASMFHAR